MNEDPVEAQNKRSVLIDVSPCEIQTYSLNFYQEMLKLSECLNSSKIPLQFPQINFLISW